MPAKNPDFVNDRTPRKTAKVKEDAGRKRILNMIKRYILAQMKERPGSSPHDIPCPHEIQWARLAGWYGKLPTSGQLVLYFHDLRGGEPKISLYLPVFHKAQQELAQTLARTHGRQRKSA